MNRSIFKCSRLMSIVLAGMLMFSNSAYAYFGGSPFGHNKLSISEFGVGPFSESAGYSGILGQLYDIGGLTFFKDYRTSTTDLDADFALGSETATFTASRSASNPATYIDASGVVQLTTTSDLPRITAGYYDESGFTSAPGLLIEGASTNYITYTDGTNYTGTVWDGWSIVDSLNGTVTSSLVALSDISAIPGAMAQRLQYTGVVGDSAEYVQFVSSFAAAGSFAQGDVVTVSVFIKTQDGFPSGISSKLVVGEYDNTYTWQADTSGVIYGTLIGNGWELFTSTVTLTEATTDTINYKIFYGNGVDEGESFDVQFAFPQVEKAAYPSSFIPTTTAALTRNAEVLKYEIADNRTAATESISVKLIPGWAGTEPAGAYENVALDNDTKSRIISQTSSTDDFIYLSNRDDSVASLAKSGVTVAKNMSTIITAISTAATGNPNTSIKDSTAAIVDNNTDWTLPAWGTYFYVGSNRGSLAQFDGIIQSINFFNKALTSTEVSTVEDILSP